MKKILPVIFGIFLCLVLIPSAGSCKDNPKAKEITVEAADKLIREKPANLVILDVRTPGEFREGHIAGAKNMDFFGGKFDVDIASLPKNSKVLVYCRSGQRSAGAVEELHKVGIKDVIHMTDGLAGWQKSKLPVEK